ncbi:MAG: hypothetical protein PUB34_07585 [Clostridia bacterium]|nr:hypothetical protein [Clostridia bacterium]
MPKAMNQNASAKSIPNNSDLSIENDKKYLEAVKNGNMATAQAMVEQAAREKGYDKGFYNIIVTQYEPDSLKQYLNDNTVIYNKKTMNGKYQVDSGRVVASAHDMPFIANAIIPENSDLSTENNKKNKSIPRRNQTKWSENGRKCF